MALTRILVKATMATMLDVDVIEDARSAAVALEPLRARILAAREQQAWKAWFATSELSQREL